MVRLNDEGSGVLGEASDLPGRSMQPLELIETALDRSGLEREEVECIAVGLGPGSYTGIRSAIATAQGWQLAREIKLVGVSSMEGLALLAQKLLGSGEATIVMDAQRNELYVAIYALGPPIQLIEPLHLRSVESTRELTVRRSRVGVVAPRFVLGPEVNRWFPEGRELMPKAAELAWLAARGSAFISGEFLEPIYLRETQFVKAPPPRAIL